MPSEAPKQESSRLPEGKWVAYRQEENGYRVIRESTLREMTIMALVNGPYIIRVDTPTEGRVYYVGTDEPYLKLKSDGKTVQWLHDLFETFRQDLIQRGFPKDTSIYRWSLQYLWANQLAIKTFPDSKVEIKEYRESPQ